MNSNFNQKPTRTFWRNRLDESKLGCYVYGIGDPRDANRLFYVGKGGGTRGKGNNRPDAHLNQAYKARKDGSFDTSDNSKISLINAIWDSGMSPTLTIIRRNISEETAFEVEAAVLETLNVLYAANLSNEQGGHNSAERGIVTEETFSVIFADPVAPVKAIQSVFIFNINKTVNERASLYEAVRGSWKIDESKCVLPSYAVGLVNGISRVVVEIASWHPGLSDPKKKSFQGRQLDESTPVGSELLGKDFSRLMKNPKTGKPLGYFQFGGVIGVNFLGGKRATITRGARGAGVILL